MRLNIISLLLSVSLYSCSSSKGELQSAGHAILTSSVQKNLLTNVKIQETGKGIKIHAQATGLKPRSSHGLHVHEIGKCEGDYTSAGDHYNPDHASHGGPASKTRHLGDLGNLVADERGEGVIEVFIDNSKHSLEQFLGKSVILHAKADDLISQPSGDSGDRIACGIIVKSTTGKN